MAVYGYVRVSTDKQDESLEVQQRQIAGYCMMRGLEAPATLVEGGVSGSVPLEQRPEGSKLLALVGRGDVVVVSKLDRVFRDAHDALGVVKDFAKRGVQLHLIDMNGDVTAEGTARLFFTNLSAMAEFERFRIRERIQQVKQQQKGKGRYLGGRKPFGWDVGADGQLVENAGEQAALALVHQMKAQGVSLRRISAQVQQATGYALNIMTLSRLTARA